MTDDDRRLADRLRRYESRVHVDADAVVVTRPRRVSWVVLGGAAAAMLLVTVMTVNLIEDRAGVGEASPTPSVSSAVTPASESPRPTTDPSPRPSESVSPNPTETPIESPRSSPGRISRWNTAGVFAESGFALEAFDVAYGAGHFIALGYREPLEARGQVGPSRRESVLWRSADGTSWEQIDVVAALGDARLTNIEALPDGSVAVYGAVDRDPDHSNEELEAPLAWRSAEGQTWEPMELTLPADTGSTKPDALGMPEPLRGVAGGPKGLLAIQTYLREEGFVDELWHSSDGRRWELVRTFGPDGTGWTDHLRSVDAGDEGFVLVGERYEIDAVERVYSPIVEASADGRTWIPADSQHLPTGTTLLVAPVGGDWIITQTNYDGTPDGTWFSHNGLHWVERENLDVPDPDVTADWGPEMAIIGHIIGAGDRAFITGGVMTTHSPWWAAGIWSSSDASSWERLGFPEDAVIAAAAVHDDVTVLVGYDGASPDADWQARATMWVSERE